MSLIIAAARFADEAHAGQKRKYTERPYIEHPGRVAARVCRLSYVNEDWVAAAWLHDVLEDCDVTDDKLKYEFGFGIYSIVKDLTNPSKAFPQLSRAERKAMDREHLSKVSFAAQCIKFIDRADNLRDMTGAPIPFKSLYAAESRLLSEAIRNVAKPQAIELFDELQSAITFLEDSIEYPDIERD